MVLEVRQFGKNSEISLKFWIAVLEKRMKKIIWTDRVKNW